MISLFSLWLCYILLCIPMFFHPGDPVSTAHGLFKHCSVLILTLSVGFELSRPQHGQVPKPPPVPGPFPICCFSHVWTGFIVFRGAVCFLSFFRAYFLWFCLLFWGFGCFVIWPYENILKTLVFGRPHMLLCIFGIRWVVYKLFPAFRGGIRGVYAPFKGI